MATITFGASGEPGIEAGDGPEPVTMKTTGQTFIDGQAMYHSESVIIGPTSVRITIEGIGPGCRTVEPLTVTDLTIIEHYRRIAAMRQETAYQNRPL